MSEGPSDRRGPEARKEGGLVLIGDGQRIPKARKPRAQDGRFFRSLGTLDQAGLVAGREAQTLRCEAQLPVMTR